MRRFAKVIFLAMLLVLAACAPRRLTPGARINPYLVEPPVCDIKAYAEKFGEESLRACIARVVAKRCNRTDACQFVCQIGGEWDHVGGGCDHMCNYGEVFELPPGAEACTAEGVRL